MGIVVSVSILLFSYLFLFFVFFLFHKVDVFESRMLNWTGLLFLDSVFNSELQSKRTNAGVAR